MCAGVQPLGSLPGKLAGPLSSFYHHQEAMSKPIQTHTPISSTGTCPLPLPFAQVSPLPTQHEENLGFYDVATLVQPFSRFICSPSHIPLTQGLKDQLLFSLSPWAAPEGISLRSKLCLAVPIEVCSRVVLHIMDSTAMGGEVFQNLSNLWTGCIH